MQLHANAKLGPAGRRELVRRIGEGDTLRAAAAALGVAPATAHRWWHRWLVAGVGERASGRWSWDRSSRPRISPRRYEWPCPGDLLHVDTKRYARFLRPGHAVTGQRAHTSAERLEQVGYEFCHAIIDDHSRLAYCELHLDERAATVTAFMTRALEWFAERGIHAKRLMSDNAWAYTRNRSLAQLLRAHG